MVYFEAGQQAAGLFRFERLVECGRLVGIEIVADQDHLSGVRIVLIKQAFDLVRPVCHGALFSGADPAFSSLWFVKHEDAGGAVAFVFVVEALGFSRLHRQGDSRLFCELDGLFIHADHGTVCIIRTLVYLQHVFHRRYEIGILFGRDDPAFFKVRFEFVFLSTLCTVFALQWGTICSSTTLSDNICNVQRARPSGGWLQAICNRRASAAPSNNGSTESFSCFLRSSAAEKPRVTNLLRASQTVSLLQ